MRFEAGIDVAAPARSVFDVYSDVERWPEWTSSMTRVERLDDGPLRVGSRARIKQPRLPVTVWQVTELLPGTSFTWVARGPGVVTTGIHEVRPSGQDGHVTATGVLVQEGLLGPLVGVLTRSLTVRYLQTEMRGLKAHCERGVA
jgi:uncharacterized membrane protein